MKIIISTFFMIMSLIISAQEDVARNMINKTEVSIYKSQKEMMAGNSQNKQSELSMAIKYQVVAVEAFKNNDFPKAICYSSKSREYSVLALSHLDGELKYYLLTKEDMDLVSHNNCSIVITTLQSGLLEESTLLDPDKLRTNYKISIN